MLTTETLQRPFAEQVRGWTRAQWEAAFTAAQVLEDVLLRPREMMRMAHGYREARHAARAARLGLQVFEPDAGGAPNRRPGPIAGGTSRWARTCLRSRLRRARRAVVA
jgi:hypothetical protein